MFLEYWMLAALTAVWGVGMWHLHRVGWLEGMKEGTENATELTLFLLQNQGLIDIIKDEKGDEILVKSIPSEEEIRKMYHALEEK